LAVGVKGSFSAPGALLHDPSTEPVAIDFVRRRDTGVRVAFDVVEESAEILLPRGGTSAPCPAGKLLESVFAIGVKSSFGVCVALVGDPLTEPVTIDLV
jgi:hypothetical protein